MGNGCRQQTKHAHDYSGATSLSPCVPAYTKEDVTRTSIHRVQLPWIERTTLKLQSVRLRSAHSPRCQRDYRSPQSCIGLVALANFLSSVSVGNRACRNKNDFEFLNKSEGCECTLYTSNHVLRNRWAKNAGHSPDLSA